MPFSVVHSFSGTVGGATIGLMVRSKQCARTCSTAQSCSNWRKTANLSGCQQLAARQAGGKRSCCFLPIVGCLNARRAPALEHGLLEGKDHSFSTASFLANTQPKKESKYPKHFHHTNHPKTSTSPSKTHHPKNGSLNPHDASNLHSHDSHDDPGHGNGPLIPHDVGLQDRRMYAHYRQSFAVY
jgi:hypothetical protein